MALTVEDGTGLANADSYISLADAETYITTFEPEGKSDWDALPGDPEKEVALRQGAAWLDQNFELSWKGFRIKSGMSLDWPRREVVDPDGYLLSSTEVPDLVKDAQVEAALLFAGGTVLTPAQESEAAIESERKELGPLKTAKKYLGAKTFGTKSTPKIDGILAGLLKGGVITGPITLG